MIFFSCLTLLLQEFLGVVPVLGLGSVLLIQNEGRHQGQDVLHPLRGPDPGLVLNHVLNHVAGEGLAP